MFEMVSDKRGNEVVTVVVPSLHSEGQGDAGGFAGGGEPFGLQLLGEKTVGRPLVDKHRATQTGPLSVGS